MPEGAERKRNALASLHQCFLILCCYLSLVKSLKKSKDREVWKTNVASYTTEQNRGRQRKDLRAIRPLIPHLISFCGRENGDFENSTDLLKGTHPASCGARISLTAN